MEMEQMIIVCKEQERKKKKEECMSFVSYRTVTSSISLLFSFSSKPTNH
jgi:hypothetical protein